MNNKILFIAVGVFAAFIFLFNLLLNRILKGNKAFFKSIDLDEYDIRPDKFRLYFTFLITYLLFIEIVIYVLDLRYITMLPMLTVMFGLSLILVVLSDRIKFVKQNLYYIYVFSTVVYVLRLAYQFSYINVCSVTNQYLIVMDVTIIANISYLLFNRRQHAFAFHIMVWFYVLLLGLYYNISANYLAVLSCGMFFGLMVNNTIAIVEEKAKNNAQKVQSIINKGPMFVIGLNDLNQIEFLNQPFLDFINQNEEDCFGKSWEVKKFDNVEIEFFENNENSIVEKYIFNDGIFKYIEWQIETKNSSTILIGFDVSQKKEQAQKLEYVTSLYSALLKNMPGIVICRNSLGEILFVNNAIAKNLNLAPDALIGKTDAIYGATSKQIQEILLSDKKVIENQEDVFIPEAEITRKDGTIGVYQVVKTPVYIPTIKQYCSLSISTDITKIKHTESLLRESESNFRQINETIENVFFLQDVLQRKCLYVSPFCEKVIGISPDEFISSENLFEKINVLPENSDYSLHSFQEILLQDDFKIFETQIHYKKESLKWIQWKLYAIKDKENHLERISGFCSDITEKKNEESLLVALNTSLEKNIKQINQTNEVLENRNKEIEELLHLNERTLFSKVLKISTYNEMLSQISKDINKHTNSDKPVSNVVLFNIDRIIQNAISEDEHLWEDFKIQFEKTRPDFFKKLSNEFPALTINDLKHCAYIIAKLSVKEVANLINANTRTIEIARYRLKKKLNLNVEDSLFNYLNEL